MIGWIVRLLMWRFARRAGPFGLLTLFGGPFPRLVTNGAEGRADVSMLIDIAKAGRR